MWLKLGLVIFLILTQTNEPKSEQSYEIAYAGCSEEAKSRHCSYDVVVFDVSADTYQIIPTGNLDSLSLDFSHDQKFVMFWDEFVIKLMNLQTNNIIDLTYNKTPKTRGYFSPDQQLIAFSYFIDGLMYGYVMPLSGEPKKNFLSKPINEFAWSPDNQYMAIVLDTNSEIGILDYYNGMVNDAVKLLGGKGINIAWSPDSEKIAYRTLSLDNPGQIVISDLAGNETQLTSNTRTKVVPKWLDNESLVYFEWSDDFTKSSIFQVNTVTLETLTLLETEKHLLGYDVSQDGLKIAITWVNNNKPQLCILTVKTRDVTCPENIPDLAYDAEPYWLQP